MKIDDEDLQAYNELVQKLREKYEVVEPFWINEETGEIVTEKDAYRDFDLSSIMERSNKQREEMQARMAKLREEAEAKRAEMDKKREEMMADAEKRREEAEQKRKDAETEAAIKEGAERGSKFAGMEDEDVDVLMGKTPRIPGIPTVPGMEVPGSSAGALRMGFGGKHGRRRPKRPH